MFITPDIHNLDHWLSKTILTISHPLFQFLDPDVSPEPLLPEDPEDELSDGLDLVGAVFASFSSLFAGLSASVDSTNDELAVLKPSESDSSSPGRSCTARVRGGCRRAAY